MAKNQSFMCGLAHLRCWGNKKKERKNTRVEGSWEIMQKQHFEVTETTLVKS